MLPLRLRPLLRPPLLPRTSTRRFTAPPPPSSSLRRPGPSSSLRRRPRAQRVTFRDELPPSTSTSTSKPTTILESYTHDDGRGGDGTGGAQSQAAGQQCDNTLLAPVHVPEDPHGVLRSSHPAAALLGNSALVVQRQLELGNLILGFEQANKYVIMDPSGNHVGFIAEEDTGIGRVIARQWFRTHRAFTTHVFDKHQREVLTFRRPFSWINSRIRVLDPLTPQSPITTSHPQPRIIGECQQEWHLLRRKYNLFLHHDPPTETYTSPAGQQQQQQQQQQEIFTQFAYVDEPFLSWDFRLLSASDEVIGSVNRNFAGFGREIFTDTGVYALRMDSAAAVEEGEGPGNMGYNNAPYHNPYPQPQETPQDQASKPITPAQARGMTLDERAVMLAAAVTIDFDYFSRHSRHGGGLGFFPFFGMGGGDFTDSSGQTGPAAGSGGWEEEMQRQQQEEQGGGGGIFGQGQGGSSGNGGGDSWPWDN